MRIVLSALIGLSIGSAAYAEPGSVLVELFTSEGCSSCPSADAVLSKLNEGDDVALLGWHVDYWDYLGWEDRYGHAAATPRQRAYGAALARGRVYTPQMVINGKTEFVGSDRLRAQKTIEGAGSGTRIGLNVSVEGESARVDVRVPEGRKRDRSTVFLAVTEDGLLSRVTRGENAGRTLHHDGVVRDVWKIGTVDGDALERSAEVSLESDWDRSALKVVVWVQDDASLEVTAVATAPLK